MSIVRYAEEREHVVRYEILGTAMVTGVGFTIGLWQLISVRRSDLKKAANPLRPASQYGASNGTVPPKVTVNTISQYSAVINFYLYHSQSAIG